MRGRPVGLTWKLATAVVAIALAGAVTLKTMKAQANPGDRVFCGTVVCKETGEPLAGVNVSIYYNKTGAITTVQTDGNGMYTHTEFTEFGGSWLICAEGDGVVCVFPTAPLTTGDLGNAFHVSLFDEAVTAGLDSSGTAIDECAFLIFNSEPGKFTADFEIPGCEPEPTPTPTPTPTPPPGGEGCTPGYWKNHLDSWVGVSPNDKFKDVFGCGGNVKLINALNEGGGMEDALKRHAVAALLNALNPGVDYPFSAADIIAATCAALASGDDATIEAQKNAFDTANNAGCPLN